MLYRVPLTLCLLAPVPALATSACEALSTSDATLAHENATCTTSRILDGGTQSSCYWTFEYRAPDAQTQFEKMRDQIETCLGTDTALPDDTPVNHPDSFVQRQYEAQGLRVSLSLKDKGQRRKTLIFLSLSAAP